MTKAKYMALADLQTVWNNKMKPYIQETYVAKSNVAAVATCESIVDELT